MAMKYDRLKNKTCVYLGYQSNTITNGARSSQPSPGDRLFVLLKLLKDKAHDPMLLPALAAGIWNEYLHDENFRSATMLREIQNDIGLMDPYLQPTQTLIQEPTEFDAVHRKIVSQHAFLTNGMSQFIADLFPSTMAAMQMFRELNCAQNSRPQQQQQQHHHQQHSQQATSTPRTMDDLGGYIEHMHFRARPELQRHDRMLSRMNVYLQVVRRQLKAFVTSIIADNEISQLYSLMQRQVARETKKDSSAMKSISLLTTVFLPATAIAVGLPPSLPMCTR